MKKVLFYLSITLLFLTSCEKELTKGPSTGLSSDNFNLRESLAISQNPINFEIEDTLFITATFNEVVTYSITIKGQNSGAIRVFSGTSDAVNEAWLGDASLIFFQKEPISISLKVLGKEEVVDVINSEITAIAKFNGVIIGDFERTTASCWFPGSNQIECNVNYDVPEKLEGEFAHLVSGKSNEEPIDNFVGLASLVPRRNVNRNGRYFSVPTTNEEELYFNIFIYGTGDRNVAMFIKFMQDDDENGSHDADRENGFEMQLTDLSHSGWKKFSFRYADVPLGGNTSFGGNGDGVYRPEKIRGIELGLWALEDPTQSVQFIYDFASFTALKPIGE